MRKEQNNYGTGGWSYFVTDPRDLGNLPAKVARLVSGRVDDLFRRFPHSIAEAADQCGFEPFGLWLHSLARTRCELEVHRPTGGPRDAVMLRFHEHSPRSWAPGIEPSPVDLVHIRADCPKQLVKIYETVGGIDTQYGGSGRLVCPSELYSAADLVERTYRQTPPEFREFSFYGNPAEYKHLDLQHSFSIWEADGDVLFWTPQGTTFWLGHEHYTGGPGVNFGDVDVVLAQIFDALLCLKDFHAD